MILGDISAKYERLSSHERRAFDSWLQRCALAGAIFAVGLLAMALAGLLAPESKTLLSTPTSSFEEQHESANLDHLPTYRFEDLTYVFTADPSARAPLTVSSSRSTAKW
jgi:hypothetical protein